MDGTAITNDANGNPLSYKGNTLNWINGRNLSSIAFAGGQSASYVYDCNGIRTSKTVNGIQHKYYFAKSIQGDVTAILSEDGTVLCWYDYDAYGRLLSVKDASGAEITDSSHIANINPVRYRGYYFDEETGFYYLNSRYYDPEICRFISPDDASLLGANGTIPSYNLYAYCENNPVNNLDANGELAFDIALGAINLVGSLISAAVTGQNISLGFAVSSFLAGALGKCGCIFAGIYTVCDLYMSGVSLPKAVLGGVVSAGLTYFTYSTLVELTCGKEIAKKAITKSVERVLASVSFTENNLLSAVVSKTLLLKKDVKNSGKGAPISNNYNQSIHGKTYDLNMMGNVDDTFVKGKTYDWRML